MKVSDERNQVIAPPAIAFKTPGLHDRNVAASWTAFLLRDDDSPRSLMDFVMNGMAGGALAGLAADGLGTLVRRMRWSPKAEEPLLWTRRGSVLGSAVCCAAYARMRVQGRAAASAGGAKLAESQECGAGEHEYVVDPWATKAP